METLLLTITIPKDLPAEDELSRAFRDPTLFGNLVYTIERATMGGVAELVQDIAPGDVKVRVHNYWGIHDYWGNET